MDPNLLNRLRTIIPILVMIFVVIAIVLTFIRFFLTRDPSENKKQEETAVIGTGTTLFKSEDGGFTWKLLDKFSGGPVTTFNFAGSDNKTLIIGTRLRGVWSGNSSGEDWKQYPGGVGEGSRIFDLVEPVLENRFTALVSFTDRGRVIEFKDGARKELFFTPLEKFAFIGGYETRDGYLRIMGSDGGVYESRDDGFSWRSISRFQRGIVAFANNPKNDSEIWAVDPQGSLYHSTNGGNSWIDITKGLRDFQGTNNFGFIFFDSRTGILYHGSKHGVLSSRDGGRVWSRIELTLAPELLPASAMAVDPDNSLRMYIGVQNLLYVSEDGGVTWTSVQIPGTGIISKIIPNPKNTREVFIGFSGK